MRILILLLSLLAVISCSAQTGKAKLYAFSQPVIPGVNPGGTTVSGEPETTTGNAGVNYFIYMSSSQRVYPSEIWIKGEPYSVRLTRVNQTPVVRDGIGGPITLVPKTSNSVWLLTPAPPIESKLSQKGRSLSANNDVVVVYRENGRFVHSVVKQMKEIEAIPLQ